MNTSDLLEQLLRGRSGQSTASQPGTTKGQGGQGGLGDLLGGLLGGGRGASGAGGLGGLGGLGGMLGGLLGGRGGSRSGSGKYAALASLGMMAFKAYQAWQQQQANAPQQALRTVDQLSEPEAEGHSHAILRALIAAAKADGRVDAQEEAAIRAELTAHAEDAQLQQWLDAELARPLDAQELASAADGPAMAAEMYLASVMLMGQQDAGERAWLDQLAVALGLAPELRAQLDQQAKAQ
ncbi:Inner membrane protein yebE [Pseudomonas rhizosphaerae]|uniref:Inner membrane protein yebE n=1 Tax=Pseudomonas rhizosphaerae TaxID=216142 RepID=A0A089YPV4_9PSED|nr:DUF533 domain-containing protein [Pseudomonas rhizosphaerae]AIS17649.1 Inner membrane protein yebE [Pseudomonas rhizosphaerae]